MFRAIKRSFTEGLKGMFKNGLMTVTSVFVVTSCIFIFGIFLMITFNMNYITDNVAKNYQMDVYVDRPSAMDDKEYKTYLDDMKKEIISVGNVEKDDIKFTTGKKYFENFKKTLSESEKESFEGLPDDFVPDLYTIKMTDVSKAAETKKALESIEGVNKVENKDDLVKIIEKTKNIVKKVSVWIIVVFAVISLFIISNTIKLTVHNRRKEINIMKYVGATDWYIKGPFIMEGMLVGLLSAVIAFFICEWVYVGICESANARVFASLLPFDKMWTQLIGAFAILGSLIGAFGSSISVRRYLKV